MKQRTKEWFFVLAALYSTAAGFSAEKTKIWIQRNGEEIKSATICFGQNCGKKEKTLLSLLEFFSNTTKKNTVEASEHSCREISDTRGADKRIATEKATRRHRSHHGTRTYAKRDIHQQALKKQRNFTAF